MKRNSLLSSVLTIFVYGLGPGALSALAQGYGFDLAANQPAPAQRQTAFAELAPTSTSSVDIDVVDQPFTRDSGVWTDPDGSPYGSGAAWVQQVKNTLGTTRGGSSGGTGGIDLGGMDIPGAGGNGRATIPMPRPRQTYGPGEYPYYQFEDGTRSYMHPTSLPPGVMFSCQKGFLDLRNPGSGWQDHPPR